MLLAEALTLAGSPTAAADDEVVITHAADGRTLDRRHRRRWRRASCSADGDTVFVPRVKTFYVLGEVRNPGAYVFESRPDRRRRRLALAGGCTPVADRSRRQDSSAFSRTAPGRRSQRSRVTWSSPNDTIQVAGAFSDSSPFTPASRRLVTRTPPRTGGLHETTPTGVRPSLDSIPCRPARRPPEPAGRIECQSAYNSA